MRELKIAYGDSRRSIRWVNKKTTFEDLCERFKTTRHTTETVAEYQKFTRGQRDATKDVGGYVLGHLKTGRRLKTNVACRSGLTLDADYLGQGFLDGLVVRYRCAIYSTHSHTPEAPRLRMVIPLTRDVTPDEYAALSRLVAEEIGMDFFDDSTYEVHRLMFWPSAPADGEYVFKVIEGDDLDPDVYLAKLSDWRDCSLWPTSSRQSAVVQRDIRQQQDPLTKDGVVGAFCRAYSISGAIDTFLSDVYAPSVMEGRYDYIRGTSSAGVVLYDDKFAYSHHATDPASGKLLNAFDLVRVHKFQDLDEKAGFKAMSELAVKDETVSDILLNDRRQRANADFSDSGKWDKKLIRNKRGEVENALGNLLLILSRDEAISGIRYNKLANQIYGENLPWERPHPAWRDADTAQLVAYVDSRYGEFTARNYELAITKVADDRAYHPIRDYLDGLPPWDETPRADTLFIDYLGADDTPYTRAVTRKTLVAAVARVRQPGIKFDSIPVLNGNQGIGKSTLLARLGRNWYSDSLAISDMKDKTAPEKLQGNWLLELSEMAGIKKMDVETVKSFASRVDDKYRPSYGRVVESHPRQCIIIGTTNNDGGFLRDVTGNRRFWPIRVTGEGSKRPWDITDEEVGQVWAEAIAAFEAGEELYLKGDVAEFAANEQRNALENDDREGLVTAYLETLLPDNWDDMDVYRRQEYYRSPDDPTRPKGTVRRMQVSNIEIWCECFGRGRDAIKKADSYEIEAIIKSIGGWERYGGCKTGKKSIPLYGIQRVYVRVE